jgi:hypothetical protein
LGCGVLGGTISGLGFLGSCGERPLWLNVTGGEIISHPASNKAMVRKSRLPLKIGLWVFITIIPLLQSL